MHIPPLDCVPQEVAAAACSMKHGVTLLTVLYGAGAEQAAPDGAGQPARGDVPAAGAAGCVRQAGPCGLQVCHTPSS